MIGTKILIGAFWTIFILYILIGSIPDSPLKLSYKGKLNLMVFAPEGWGFFTRSPREPALHLYKKIDEQWRAYGLRNTDADNLFGLKKDSRLRGVELGAFVRQVPQEQWVELESDLNIFLKNNSIPALDLVNNTPVNSLCGEIVIEERELVPWAWSKSRDSIQMPSKIVLLNIRCET